MCPYYKNREVFDDFNRIIQAFGGKPMTEDEFKSSELRNQRTGQDLVAVECAYILWDKNNGYSINKTPSGGESVVWNTLMKVYGDENLAIKIKSQMYSDEYLNKYGNWINSFYETQKEPDIKTIAPKYTDESSISQGGVSVEKIDATQRQYYGFVHSDIMSKETYDQLISGGVVSSKDIVQHMLTNGVADIFDNKLLQVLSLKNVPIVFGDSSCGCAAVTVTDKKGRSVVVLNSRVLPMLSKKFVTEAVVHEMIHAMTVDAINNPKTELDRQLARTNHDVYSRVKDLVKRNMYDVHSTSTGTYAFANEKEFMAYFMSDELFRQSLYDAMESTSGYTQRTFKNVVKKITQAVLNFFMPSRKSVLTSQQLKEYENTILGYIRNNKSTDGLTKEDLTKVYSSIRDGLAFNERMQFSAKALEKALKSYEVSPIDKNLATSYEDVCRSLATRLLSIRDSDMSADQKQQTSDDTVAMIELLSSESVPKYTACAQFVAKIGPYILDKIRYVEENRNVLTPQQLRFLLHSDFNTFNIMADKLIQIIDLDSNGQQKLIDQYNRSVLSTDPKISIDEVQNLVAQLKNVRDLCKDAVNLCDSVVRQKSIEWHYLYGHEAGSPTIDDYVSKLFDATQSFRPDDISSFEQNLGAVDRVGNETLRIISHIVTEADDNATVQTIDKITDLINLAKKLKRKTRALLYERDEKGNATGYLVRKLNHGIHNKDYDEFMVALNRAISAKYNIHLEDDNRRAPEDKDARKEWQLARNEWFDIHSERQYTKEYYDAWANLSQETRDALRGINTQLYSLTHREHIYDPEKKIFRYENFTKEEWEQFTSLTVQKKLLRSKYDVYGNKKTGQELETAEELQKLYDTLYDKGEVKKNVLAWQDARNDVIEQCGGQAEYKKFLRGEANSFDSKKLREWDHRNSRLQFKKNDDGDAEVFQKIYRDLGGEKPYYGDEYEDISKQINEMLKPFRGPDGSILSSKMTNSLKNSIKQLSKRQSEIRHNVIKNNPQLKALSKKYGQIFNKYLEFCDTQEFSQIKDALMHDAQGNFDLYNMLIAGYGTSYFDPVLGQVTNFTPYRWYQILRAKDSDFMELVPGDGWIEKTDNNKYTNPDFDPNYGTTIIPKAKITKKPSKNGVLASLGLDHLDDRKAADRYDNSKVYNYVTNNGTMNGTDVADFYKYVKDMMHESNQMQTNRPIVDDYLLPQIQGSLWTRMKSKNWWGAGPDSKFGVFARYVLEKLGFKVAENDDDTYGATGEQVDQYGNPVQSKFDPFKDTYTDNMPDGSVYRAMPQFYTRKLKDPASIHTNLVAMLATYYAMSCRYKERAAIADQCELLLEQLGKQTMSASMSTKIKSLGKQTLVGGDNRTASRTYQMGREWLDMNLYDMRKIAQGFKGWDATKFASLLKQWTTVVNLGMNPKVAIVGMLTTGWTHLINSLTGQKYDFATATRAGLHTIKTTIKRVITGDIFSSNSDDKVQLLMELSGVANQLTRKTQNFNLNPVLEFIQRHAVFGLMSSCDYFMKGQITASTYMSYRFVDGEFLTKDDIRMRSYQAPEGHVSEWRKEMFDKWNDGITLFDALSVSEDRKLVVTNPKYNEAWLKIRNVVKNRAEKFCEHADGMATEKQKGTITRGILGSMILIHRQYLPLMLQERFGETVYDYDTHMYGGGQFRSVLNFMYCLASRNKYIAAATGVALGSILPFGAVGSAIAGISMFLNSMYKQNLRKKSGVEQESLKAVFNHYFNDFSTQQSTAKSQANRYAFKQIGIECAAYFTMLQTFVNLLCFYADDPRRKKWYLLQALAYWARGVQWEAGTPYRMKEIFDAMKSPSAALSSVDRLSAFMNMYSDSIFDIPLIWIASLFDSTSNELQYKKTVTKGVYKGKPTWFKNTMRLTPYKNIYEQVEGSREKRNYQERQLMGITKDKQETSVSKYVYDKLFE